MMVSFGNQGAEVKSMRISSPTNESRYWKDRFAVDSAKQDWMLVVGSVELPTRNEYDFIEAIQTLGDYQNSLSDSIVISSAVLYCPVLSSLLSSLLSSPVLCLS